MISNIFNSYNQTQPPNSNQLLNIESTYGCFFYTITQIINQLGYYCDCNHFKMKEKSPLDKKSLKNFNYISFTFLLQKSATTPNSNKVDTTCATDCVWAIFHLFYK